MSETGAFPETVATCNVKVPPVPEEPLNIPTSTSVRLKLKPSPPGVVNDCPIDVMVLPFNVRVESSPFETHNASIDAAATEAMDAMTRISTINKDNEVPTVPIAIQGIFRFFFGDIFSSIRLVRFGEVVKVVSVGEVCLD